MNRFYKAVAEALAIRYTTDAATPPEAERQAELEAIIGLLCTRFASEDKGFDEPKFLAYLTTHARSSTNGTSS